MATDTAAIVVVGPSTQRRRTSIAHSRSGRVHIAPEQCGISRASAEVRRTPLLQRLSAYDRVATSTEKHNKTQTAYDHPATTAPHSVPATTHVKTATTSGHALIGADAARCHTATDQHITKTNGATPDHVAQPLRINQTIATTTLTCTVAMKGCIAHTTGVERRRQQHVLALRACCIHACSPLCGTHVCNNAHAGSRLSRQRLHMRPTVSQTPQQTAYAHAI